MSVLPLDSGAVATPSLLDRFRRFMKDRRARRLAISQLDGLDDRQLRDLGIERADIAVTVDREIGRFRVDEFRSRG